MRLTLILALLWDGISFYINRQRAVSAYPDFHSWATSRLNYTLNRWCHLHCAALAAQSLLAALGSVQFVANIVFGRIVLKEKVRSEETLSTEDLRLLMYESSRVSRLQGCSFAKS